MPHRLIVFFAPAPVDGTFFQVCRELAGELETILVVDVEEEGGTQIAQIIEEHRDAGVPVELDPFARRRWGQLLAGDG